MDDFEIKKQECCNLTLDYFKATTQYRLDDAWDWLCDNIDLDTCFDEYLNWASNEIYGKNLVNAFSENILNCQAIAYKIAKRLNEEMETKLWSEV